MSILLDALKKSEAQRQLGQTPTLETNLDGHVVTTGENHILVPAALIGLAAVLITWFGYQQFQLPQDFSGAALAPGVVAESGPGSTSPQTTTEADSGAASAKTPVMDFKASEDSTIARNESEGSARETAPDASPSEAVRSFKQQDKPSEAEAIRNRLNKARASARTSARNERNKTLPPSSADKNEDQFVYETEPIIYWAVPQSVRGDLPELKITVLVYAEKPENRFLLINGERWLEQEEVSRGLVLEEIQRGRAIFSYRNYLFYING